MSYPGVLKDLLINGTSYRYHALPELSGLGFGSIDRLPFSIRILVENLLRRHDGVIVSDQDLAAIADWRKTYRQPVEIAYHPARVLMQDFTGVPAVVDLAAMRDAVRALGGDPRRVNPQVPVELIEVQSGDYLGEDDIVRYEDVYGRS